MHSGKRNVTFWRPSVRPSVCLSRRQTHRDSPGAACETASVGRHFGLTIRTAALLGCSDKERLYLARGRSKDPVSGPRGVAEERKREDEEFVGECQVPDVVVAHGAVADGGVARDNEQDERVSDESDDESNQVGRKNRVLDDDRTVRV